MKLGLLLSAASLPLIFAVTAQAADVASSAPTARRCRASRSSIAPADAARSATARASSIWAGFPVR